jgi:hypothetical protein
MPAGACLRDRVVVQRWAQTIQRAPGVRMRPTQYEIRLRGHVEALAFEDFGQFRAAAPPVQTILRGHVQDEVALLSLLSRIRSLGFEVLSARRLPGSQRRGPESRLVDDERTDDE